MHCPSQRMGGILEPDERKKPMLPGWEHLVITLEAKIEPYEDLLRARWPDVSFAPYAPEALIPQLDERGREGWELVSVQPVMMGKHGDIAIDSYQTMQKPWTYRYLCVFKRPLLDQ